eukprot:TRINITY_DN2142_c0_g1_i1.p1 TRINITY_DN2142_c0_g1~~TRINITY_DN2142_c0_g1_i1.p1  ORF type:complete len:107 (-),score=27.04 TRINITY_DN2142_c0_g1_i1:77-397(-)
MSMGGEDAGPTPYELLLSSIGQCTALTVRIYADRKQIPVEHIKVTLEHEKVKSEDGWWIDSITSKLHLEGPDLTEEDKKKLFQMAGMCPVKKSVTSGKMEIISSLE